MNKIVKMLFMILVFHAFSSVIVFADEKNDAEEFCSKLEKGEPYATSYVHPMTGEIMKREIVGMEGDKCVYAEELPNGGKMECRFSPSYRKAMAQYYRDTLYGKSEIKKKYTVNGKETENPLQEAFDDGTCVFTGY